MKKSIIFVFAAALVLASCQSLDLSSSYQVASSNVWGKATLARQAVNGIYNEFYVRSSTSVNEDDWKVMYEAYSSVMDTDKNTEGMLRRRHSCKRNLLRDIQVLLDLHLQGQRCH